MRYLYLGIFLLTTVICNAQSNYKFGLLPSLNIIRELPKDYKFSFELESRQALEQGDFGARNSEGYEYILTDLTSILSKKISSNKSVALGYLFRIKDGKIIHRSIQHFVLSKKYSGLKLAYRLATDQTFFSDEPTQFRARFRVSSVFSLTGTTIDPKEFFLKINNEYLYAIQKEESDLEARLTPFLGYKFSERSKMELGLDYRINSFIDDSGSHRFWIALNWYRQI